MKLKQNEIDFLETVVTTARIVGIDNIIIEPGYVRGIDDASSVVLLQSEVPELSFGSVGLNRTQTFLARFDIAKERDKFTITATLGDDDSNHVRSFVLKAKGVSVDYRCANPNTIRAPKTVNDEWPNAITLNEECIKLMTSGLAAMKSETITIVSDDEGIHFIFIDTNNDELKGKISDPISGDDEPITFVYKYPAKMLLDLFRKNPTGEFFVGEKKGVILFNVNMLNLYILPQV